MKHFAAYLIALALSLPACTCAGAKNISGLNEKQFGRYWQVESESPDYKVTFAGDTCEVTSPKGLTLWYKKKLSGNIVIEYDAVVFLQKEGDRLSDLNCFWMASDPKAGSVFKRSAERRGVFANCAQLKLYYLGYGGNHNTTTRFRRYDGNPEPAVIAEYTDSAHLLKPNHWYHIKLVCNHGRVQYWIDGECLVDYSDPHPYTGGWFGFRTTLSRTAISNFKVERLKIR